MFPRASSRTYVCLKRQHRLAHRTSSYIDSNTSAATKLQKRWQTAIAAQPQEQAEEPNIDSKPFDLKHELTEPGDSRRITKWRHWQPPRTADLGVKVLGKPAEVLVLEDEDRRRGYVAPGTKQRNIRKEQEADPTLIPENKEKDSVDDESNTRLHDVITAENKNISPDEAQSNIDEVKKGIIHPPGQIPQRELIRHRQTLRQGFTVEQLERYINNHISKSLTAPDAVDNNPQKRQIANRSKNALAEHIILNLWGYRSEHNTSHREVIARKASINPQRRDLVLKCLTNDRKFQSFNIQATAIGPDKIEITGPEAAVVEAMSAIEEAKDRIVSTVISLPIELDVIFQQERNVRARENFVKLAMQLTGVTIDSNYPVRAFALHKGNIAQFEQMIHQQYSPEAAESHTLPLSIEELNAHSTIPMLFPSKDPSALWWHRFVSSQGLASKAADVRSTSLGAKLTALSTGLQAEVQNGPIETMQYKFLPREARTRGILAERYEASALYALYQNLADLLHSPDQQQRGMYNRTGETAESEPSSPSAKSKKAKAVPQLKQRTARKLPLVSQWLAQQKPAVSPRHGLILHQDSRFRQVEMTFAPTDPLRHPSLTISAKSNQDDQLDIQTVCLNIPNSPNRILALPSLSADLEFKRDTLIVIFEKGQQLPESSKPILAQLANQLFDPTSPNNSGLSAFDIANSLELDFSSLLSHLKPQVHGTQGLTRAQKKRAMKAEDSTQQHIVRYVLKRADWVDKLFYRTPVESPFLLEYSSSSSLPECRGSWNLNDLRIVEAPDGWVSEDSKRKLEQKKGKSPKRQNKDNEKTPKAAEADVQPENESKWQPTFIRMDPEKFKAFVKASYETVQAYTEFVRKWTKDHAEKHTSTHSQTQSVNKPAEEPNM